jgi:hypothetical protein
MMRDEEKRAFTKLLLLRIIGDSQISFQTPETHNVLEIAKGPFSSC